MYTYGQLVKERYEKCLEAAKLFMAFYNAPIERICIENPTPLKIAGLPAYTQVIQPWEHGHPYSKRTCLWLKNLPQVIPTMICENHEPFVNGGCKDAHGKPRKHQGNTKRDAKSRSKTFPGIAAAMAEQWGGSP